VVSGRVLNRGLPARGRVPTVCVCLAAAAAIGGCQATGSTPSVKSSTLKVYVSVPPGGGGPAAQDVLAAERLAFQQAGATVDRFTVKLVTVQGTKLSDNARSAIKDSSTIAYLGELAPGASADSLGITNALDVLQVSPVDTAVELTESTPAVSGSPNNYYESLSAYGRTFARVVPTDRLEAKALVQEMGASGVRKLYVTADGSAYGKALALAMTDAAYPSITVVPGAGTADAIFFAGGSSAAATSAFDAAVASNPALKLFAPSALAQDSFAAALSPAAQKSLVVSAPGFSSADLPAQGQQFESAFRAAYGHAPATEAIFGYEAMAAVMYALKQSGSGASNRGTVVHNFFAIRNRSSALGTYSINSNGDTNIAPFVFLRVSAGALAPYKAVQAQG
jgi:branched-chain amino acid transport system substrate-binding protein